MKTSPIALLAALGATSAAAQPDTWDLLDDIEIDEIVTETSYEVKKRYPAGIAEAPQSITITGYAAPALPGELVQELMLVADMGTCPFCGSLDHGASLMVSLAEPIPAVDENKRITLQGTLRRVTDPQTWQAVIMEDARIVSD
ncbi:hypothetical protein [Pacificoceanicola onchidii]|uniref:hypothetical protein n=1 Tax=Pacificoceanicola onchidii TaxID=2562685 RepID=UPI0010A36161|nr:hypothetical protein [Pacificoceanicola onchidii]